MALFLAMDPMQTVFAINVIVAVFRFTLVRVVVVGINRKYYASQKSRSNSNYENSISFETLINKSPDSVVDKNLPEIWNNAWSEQLL
ncbi:6820_t:CDS:2 [Dentiscutata erythropus]|uniref:6820_t:CDS:1 n=1 Tax=Dentiscutata erythropus TaxID=1348616 RepID=A0A9N8W4D2_9GLOM|nr:6820_t:CDS:2 [Dentiscutata erythropus]